jgi:HSP90 family molecular chaperone
MWCVCSYYLWVSNCESFFFEYVKILRAEIGQRLLKTPCALITSKFGWTGNMQRIIASQTHSKTQDVQRE